MAPVEHSDADLKREREMRKKINKINLFITTKPNSVMNIE